MLTASVESQSLSRGAFWRQGALSVLILAVCSVWVLHAYWNAPNLLQNLHDFVFDPPPGTAPYVAERAIALGIPSRAKLAFPLNVVVYIEGPQAAVQENGELGEPVADFLRGLVGDFTEESHPRIVAMEGYGITNKTFGQEARAGRADEFYVSPVGAPPATFLVIHTFPAPPAYAWHVPLAKCDEWTAPGGALEGHLCAVLAEGVLVEAAKKASVESFERSDMVGIPLAMLGLLRSVGSLGLVVLLMLPVTLLSSFNCCELLRSAMPEQIRIPAFALSLVVSVSTAMTLDYALFLISSYRRERKKGYAHGLALTKALPSAGRTILISGLIMVVSNVGALLMPKPNIGVRSLSVTIAVACGNATLVSLTVLPAIIFLLGPLLIRLGACLRRCASCGRQTSSLRREHGRRLMGRGDPSDATAPSDVESEFEDLGGVRAGSRYFGGVRKSFWGTIASVVGSHPHIVMACVCLAGFPMCQKAFHLNYAVSLTAVMPRQSEVARGMRAMGEIFPLGILDVKPVSVRPRYSVPEATEALDASECLDEDITVMQQAEAHGFGRVGCQEAVFMVGCTYKLANFTVAHQEQVVYLQHYCPRSCPAACSRASLLSRPYLTFLGEVELAMTTKVEACGGRADQALESIASLDGKPVSFERARELLALAAEHLGDSCGSEGGAKNDCPDVSPELEQEVRYARRYVQRLQAMGNHNRSHTIMNLLVPFNTFADRSFRCMEALYGAMEPGVAVQTTGGAVVVNDENGAYEVLLGGVLNGMRIAVDKMLQESVPRMVLLTIVTVLLSSLASFKSIFIGPRLLLTVLFTVSFTLGLSTLIFTWIDDEGLHWVVLLVSIPCMLGLTLDYDIFLLSRVYECRLQGMDTKQAVLQALPDTGPIITVAGMIMMAAFGALLLSGIPSLQQFAVILVICCAVDTFVVRIFLVPAMMLVLVEYNWWPGRMPLTREEEHELASVIAPPVEAGSVLTI